MTGDLPGPAGPLALSLLVPVYRTPLDYLTEMVGSVQAQTDPRWQLILLDDGSGDPDLTAAMAELGAGDQRIVMASLPVNSGIVAATAAALELATGEFVALLDHDDLLAPTAVERVRNAIAADPQIDMLYTDEDQLHPDGEFRAAFAKPEFSLSDCVGRCTLGHLTVYRRSLIDRVGGIRSGYDGSQDYDLALRATEQARTVAHLPEVLYHWRIHRSPSRTAPTTSRCSTLPVARSPTISSGWASTERWNRYIRWGCTGSGADCRPSRWSASSFRPAARTATSTVPSDRWSSMPSAPSSSGRPIRTTRSC